MDLPTLDTRHLVLRPYSSADIPDLVRLAGAREIAATTLRIPHPYREQDAVDFVAACQPDADAGQSVRFAITLRDTGGFCGGVGMRLELDHYRAELGYWLGVPYWGRGYATEAGQAMLRYGFDTLGLHRIYAQHVRENPASGHVLKKIGMRYEGCLRHHICKWDQFQDLEVYGLLKSELPSR
jgi:[ribosomal protein S5]-alanine N-acetyltransferase